MNNADAPRPPADKKPPPTRPAVSWEKATDLFTAALEVPVSERKQWLSGLTGVDEALRQEVASLLEANEKAKDFLISRESDRGSKRKSTGL